MTRLPSRAAGLGLVVSLFLSSIPLPAAAALGKIAPAVPVNSAAGIGAAGAVRFHTLAPASLNLPAASHSIPALDLSVSAPALAPSLVPAPIASNAADRSIRRESATSALRLEAANDAPGAKTVIAGVETAFTRLQGAKDSGAAPTGAVLDELFEGFTRKDARLEAANDAPVSAAPGRAAPLAPAAAPAKSAAADGPRWVFNEAESAGAPKTGWKRTFSVGLLTAVVPLVLTTVIVGVAQLLGYELHPNYANPADALGRTPSIAAALTLVGAAAVMAPIAEEIVFRAGLQGGLAKLTKFLRMGSFWVPAVLSSLIFVAIHETADPVLFTTRFIHSMMLAYAFKKEGVLSSMAAHAFFNGILTLPVLAAALAGVLPVDAAVSEVIALGGIIAGLIGLVFASIGAFRHLRAQQPDIASGAVAAKPFELRHGVVAAALLAAGFFLLMPNPFWLLGLIGLVFWLPVKRVKG